MKRYFNSILNFVAECKVYFSNAAIYLNVINFVMILATFKLAYNIQVSIFVLVPVGFIAILLVGWLDYKIIYSKQLIHINKQNDIKAQLDRIEKQLKEK